MNKYLSLISEIGHSLRMVCRVNDKTHKMTCGLYRLNQSIHNLASVFPIQLYRVNLLLCERISADKYNTCSTHKMDSTYSLLFLFLLFFFLLRFISCAGDAVVTIQFISFSFAARKCRLTIALRWDGNRI